MTHRLSFNRRQFLQTTSAAAALGVLGTGPAAAASATVGFIYVGPKDDYGYNQAHAEGAAALKKMPGITVVEEENVPETVDVPKTMESHDQPRRRRRCSSRPRSAISTRSCWPWPRRNIPNVQFRHCGGLWNKASTR